MELAARQAALLADTSPFCRFAECGICELLVDYLGDRLHLTTWVIAELEHRAKQAAHAQLRSLEARNPSWVTNPPVQLTEPELRRADALARGWSKLQARRSGSHRDDRANLGETTTILAAEKHDWAVILDEGRARAYAEKRGLTVLSTQDLVVEMTAVEQLKGRRAFHIYKRVYSNATETGFTRAVASAQDALDSPL
ncbi:MAG TPA: hypothetical protein VMU55_04200 [Solirubrobacteraceae bacterium]|nr:hypothetical protein [Solirubrobacteraceae bacterium]